MIEDRPLWAPTDVRRVPIAFDLGRLRAAIRARHKLRFLLGPISSERELWHWPHFGHN